ncbi:formate dehydrogenase accessory sulfurtransferase FdhD [Haloferula rosea]|nr:formate dehydrogenase accessory sulfurtransferase FdhD [Haloferula rosea]
MDRAIKVLDASGMPKSERVAVEEPLQITLDGCPVAVVMRTPGHDVDLVRGFLRTEGATSDLSVVRKIDLKSKPNHALVFLEDQHDVDLSRLQRNLFSASSCGICGKASIEAVAMNHPALEDPVRFPKEAVLGTPDRLRRAQATFDATGGLHAAGLFDRKGELLFLREDVGRHNAVDKVIGRALGEGVELAGCFLLVSGRVSFEIMQKALVAGIPLVAAISAPSSLAVEFAEQSGQALVAFLRPPKFNLYAGHLA